MLRNTSFIITKPMKLQTFCEVIFSRKITLNTTLKSSLLKYVYRKNHPWKTYIVKAHLLMLNYKICIAQ